MTEEREYTLMVRHFPNGDGSDVILVEDGVGLLLGSFFPLNDGSLKCCGHFYNGENCSSVFEAMQLAVKNYEAATNGILLIPVGQPEEILEGSPEELEFYREDYDQQEPESSGRLGILFVLVAILYFWWWSR